MENSKLNLNNVQETLFLPLWGRAVESHKKKPLLYDDKALSIIRSIPYDFSVISKNISQLVQAAWIARSIFFDKKIKEFISLYPNATVVNIGCGLDTTFSRVDNGKIMWFDLDLPETIELRRQFIEESERHKFIAESVFNQSWFDLIPNKKNLMFLIAGVIYYFEEQEVKGLFNDFHNAFPCVELIFDYSSIKGMKISNKKVIEKGGMSKSACLKWGIDNIYEIEKWGNYLKVIETMPMYKEHKNNFSYFKRLGMNIADKLKVMSLTHIKIN